MIMKLEINVPDYSRELGLQLVWEAGFAITVQSDQNAVVLQANRAGFVSLARHLLLLANVNVPVGSHLHLDSLNALEDGSCELIVEKV